MRTWTKILASSVYFSGSSGQIRTPFATSSNVVGLTPIGSQFGSQGAFGGPVVGGQVVQIILQGNFGGGINGGFGGTFNLLESNSLELPNFTVAASAYVPSTGSVLVKDQIPAKYTDFQYIPATSASTGFITVIAHYKEYGV